MFKEVSLVYFSSTKTTQRTVRAIGRALAKAFDISLDELVAGTEYDLLGGYTE